MNERAKILSEEAAKLKPDHRLELVEAINLSLLSGDGRFEDAWDREAVDRFGPYDRGEMRALSWEEVKKRRASK